MACASDVDGKFCSACGESTVAHMPSAGEFAHEFVGHFVALEGKLWKTLQLLILHPGQLTVEFLSGRRVPFVAPLRLYLSLSLVFFLLIKLFGIELPRITIAANSLGATYSHSIPSASRPGKMDTATFSLSARDEEAEKAAGAAAPAGATSDIADAIAAVGAINTNWMNRLKRFFGESDAEKAKILNHGFVAYLPYMLIGALPLFALYLKVIYLRSGRRYGEHLVFALHANSFAFLVAGAMIVLPGSLGWVVMAPYLGRADLVSIWDAVQLVPFLCLLVYLPFAMQRVYGGKPAATVARWLVLMTAHLTVIAACTALAELIAILGRA